MADPEVACKHLLEKVEARQRLRVTAPPEAGKANQAVIALLSDTLGIARFRVRIIRGRGSREKLVSIASLTTEQVLLRLAPALE